MLKVLFVDNDEEDMFLFDKAMNTINQQFDINYAVCGDDLFYFLKASYPDLLFLDINVPELEGIECLKKIRLIDKSLLIPIIIYSAFLTPELVDECYEEKANYLSLKPKDLAKSISQLKKVFSINWIKDRFPSRDAFVIQ